MDYKLIISDLANSDLDGIVEYIINDLKSSVAASILLDKLKTAINSLEKTL